MQRIILITGTFPVLDSDGYPTDKREFTIDHAFNESTMEAVVVPSVHPLQLGGKFDTTIQEWVLEN